MKNKRRILVVEDDELFRQAMTDYLANTYLLSVAVSAEEAITLLAVGPPDLILLDITLPGADGTTLLQRIRKEWPQLPVIMLTAIDKIQTVVECIKLGAFDYLAKPLIVEELLTSIQRALESTDIRQELEQRRRLQLAENREYRLLGESPAMGKVRKEIEVVARSDSPVLIVGETGTGKELVAREIHARSARATEPFVAINCGAIAKDLFESEFFGHKKGAFTGAQTNEIGKFQLANRGTLLLDEISELPFDAQTKLLRVLEHHEFYPVGSTGLMRVDVRVLAATNRNLEDLVQQRLFREDLFFRLNVYTIHIPPLRERPEDMEVLAEFYLAHFNAKFGKEFRKVAPEAREVLLKHPWKGNVRELRNLMERIILSEDGTYIEKKHLLGVLPFAASASSSDVSFKLPQNGIDLEELEKNFLVQALELAGGNKTKAAKLLGLTPATLYYRLEKYHL